MAVSKSKFERVVFELSNYVTKGLFNIKVHGVDNLQSMNIL